VAVRFRENESHQESLSPPKCARCGERETVMKGERGPASIYCDLCRDEVKPEQNALRAQAYRQRKASYRGVR